MEKKYEKPQILFENIQMNTSIASCEYVLVGKGGGYIESWSGILYSRYSYLLS